MKSMHDEDQLPLVDESYSLMTLEQFISSPYPTNAYVEREGWESLYVRKNPVAVIVDGKVYRVVKCITFSRIAVEKPGNGLFTALVKELVDQGWAIYVECVLSPRFQAALRRRGFLELKSEGSPSFLFNHEKVWHQWSYHGGI